MSNHWNPDRSGDYAQQCNRGRTYAREMLERIRETGDPTIYANVCRSMTEAGIWGGVEIGFCTEIGIQQVV